MVLTNPPFGRKSSYKVINSQGEAEREGVAVQVLQQGPDPLLARHRDLAAQRARHAAERGEHVLGQVGGLVADLPEAPGPG